MLAPPWIAVPPAGYGGVETVVADLTEALVERGHDVTLFCAPGSHSSATTVPLLDDQHPAEIERSLYEADHVARAFAAIDVAGEEGSGFDIVHDHCGFTALAMADRLETPLLHTLHGPFTRETATFYAHHAGKAWVAGHQRRSAGESVPTNLRSVGAIPNPIAVDAWPFQRSDDGYLLWIGRMTPEKGPHRAIEIARAAGQDLILAGVVQPGQRSFFERHVEPHIDGRAGPLRRRGRWRPQEEPVRRRAGAARADPLARAVRHGDHRSAGLRHAVLAFDEGAVTELVDDGITGFIVEDEPAMVAALRNVKQIDPAACRRWVAEHCDVKVVAGAYEAAYRTVLQAGSRTRQPAPV